MCQVLVFEKTLYSSILLSIQLLSQQALNCFRRLGDHLREVRQLPGWGEGGGALEERLGRGVPPKCHTLVVEGPVKYFAIAVNGFGIR